MEYLKYPKLDGLSDKEKIKMLQNALHQIIDVINYNLSEIELRLKQGGNNDAK